MTRPSAVSCIGTPSSTWGSGMTHWVTGVDYVADNGVYEAYYNSKIPRQSLDRSEAASLYPRARTACT